jgi:hypothetical protein
MRRKKRRTSKETIRRVGEILEEFLIGNLESEFPVGAPDALEPAIHVEGQPEEPAIEAAEQDQEDIDEGQSDEEAEDESYDETKFYFDLADVEYCVDVAITEIVNEKLIAGYDDPRKPPILSEIFHELFGEDDSLIKQVEEFEKLISGYDDHVHIDDLQQADDVMKKIVKEIEDRSKD